MGGLNKSNLVILKGKTRSGKTAEAKKRAEIALDEGKRVYVFDCYDEYDDLIQYASKDGVKKHALAVYTGFEYTPALEYLNMVKETETSKQGHMKSYLIVEGFGQLVKQEEQMEFFRILDKLTTQNVEALITMQDLDGVIDPFLLPWVLEKSHVSDFA